MSESDVHPMLRNAVVAAIWLTVIVPAVALTVSVSLFAVRYGINGDLAVPAVQLGPQTQLLLVLAIVGGYGFIIWMAMRETFGGGDVDAGVEQAQDVAETVNDELND